MAMFNKERNTTKITAPALCLMASVFFLAAGLPMRSDAQQGVAPSPNPATHLEKVPAQSEAAPAGLLKIKTTDQGIRYASGGVGQEERAELRALSAEFNLELMFAVQGGGEYLADVQVNIVDAKGAPVLSATSKGPYFIAQLPKGRYTVEVSANNESQKKTAQIDSGQTKLSFYWR